MAQPHSNYTRRAQRAYPRARPAAVLRQVKVYRPSPIETEGVIWIGLLATFAAICVLVIIRALGE